MAGMGPAAVLPADDNNEPIMSASDAIQHAAEDEVSPRGDDEEVFTSQPMGSQGEDDRQEERVDGELPIGAQTPLEDELAEEVQDMV